MTTSAEKWYENENAAWSSGDIEHILDCYNDDCTWDIAATGQVHKGKDEIRKYFKGVYQGFPDFTGESKSYFISENKICAEAVISGTWKGELPNMPPPTGKPWSTRSVRVIELKNGKASKITAYYDLSSFREQVGVVSPQS